MAEPCMSPDAAARRASKLAGWTLDTASEPLKLCFCRKLPDFRAGLAWINRVGMLAEEHDHHPDFHLTGWNQVELVLWSHDSGGLTERDFALAAEITHLATR
jgi:4a-hydroxytetrahydrobiopterin dehydratase